MRAVRIRVRGLLNSFRDPTTHTYQRTLPLPPVTTLRGMLGAALGLSPDETDNLNVGVAAFRLRREAPSVLSESEGRAIDLWKYRKYKGGKFETSSILERELLYRNDYDIYYQSLDDDLTVEHIAQAFEDPQWALSLGREDELIHVTDVEVVELAERMVGTFRETLLPIDVKTAGQLAVSVEAGQSFVPPLVLRLPTRFNYADNGVRTPTGFRTFSFIGPTPFRLSQSQSGAHDEQRERDLLFA